jgi:hypothetical protein
MVKLYNIKDGSLSKHEDDDHKGRSERLLHKANEFRGHSGSVNSVAFN